MGLSRPRADFAIGAAIVTVAVIISSIGIRRVTGRLSPQPANERAQPYVRPVPAHPCRRDSHLGTGTACGFPLAGVDFSAGIAGDNRAMRQRDESLAEPIAPLDDLSLLGNKDRWPQHLMSAGAAGGEKRCAALSPMARRRHKHQRTGPAHRSAVTQGCRRMANCCQRGVGPRGWRVLDADTIPVQMQQITPFENEAIRT